MSSLLTSSSLTHRGAVALLTFVACFVSAARCGPSALSPQDGLPFFQERMALNLPGGTVNMAGGNLLVRRVDLSRLDRRGEPRCFRRRFPV